MISPKFDDTTRLTQSLASCLSTSVSLSGVTTAAARRPVDADKALSEPECMTIFSATCGGLMCTRAHLLTATGQRFSLGR